MTDSNQRSVTSERSADTDGGADRTLFREAMTNTFRPWAGWVFYGFGALFVLIGYLGISGEAVVAKQLPYLISGGIGGILLAVLGAYLLGIEELRKDSGRLDRIEQQIQDLHLALLSRPDAPIIDTADGPSRSNERAGSTPVVAVESGTVFHVDTCALVAGKDAHTLGRGDVAARGLAPCRVCEPEMPTA